MSDYRKGFREAESEAYWTMPRIFGAIITIAALVAVFWIIAQPMGLIKKTLNADNVITTYEWFHDANGNYKAKVAQIKQFKGLRENEADKAEKSRLTIELSAIQQSCRDLANRYNANAIKTNKSIFMGREAPEMLDVGGCE